MFTRAVRALSLAGAAVLLAGVTGISVLLAQAPARAVACGTAEPAGTPCTLTGTVGVTAGTLSLTVPSALGWSAADSGLDQQLVDTTSAHQSYVVNDATGSGAGWHVTISATTFTAGSSTLANSGTFLTTGSATSESATTAPTVACSSGATCALPTDTTTYPVAFTTAASSPAAYTIYDVGAGTGMGSITIGIGANPVGWWVNLPAKSQAGSYTSTITLQIVSGP